MSSCIFFKIKQVIRIHDFLIQKSGGCAGIRDIGIIESALAHIQNDCYYPEFEDKLTHLVFFVNKSHAFNDGNKRTSVALGAYLLEVNGIEYCIDNFITEMENIAVHIANNLIDKSLLKDIIYSIINEDFFSEELKLKITDAIQPKDIGNEVDKSLDNKW